MDIDWRWVSGLAGTALLYGLSRLNKLTNEIEALKKRLNRLDVIRGEPFPSDTAEEMVAVKAAKELSKKLGGTFTFEQAYKAVKMVRDAKKAKETSGGDNTKRTA